MQVGTVARWTVSVILGMVSLACDGRVIPQVASEAGLALVSPDCATLLSCCPSLPSEITPSCGLLANQAVDSECQQEVTKLSSGGYCHGTEDGGASIDAGEGRDTGRHLDAGTSVDASAAPACTLLQACCGSSALPSTDTATCKALATANDEMPCASLLSTLTQAMECGSVAPGGNCPALEVCCTSSLLPSNFQTGCIGTAMAGIDRQCTHSRPYYQQVLRWCLDGRVAPEPSGVYDGHALVNAEHTGSLHLVQIERRARRGGVDLDRRKPKAKWPAGSHVYVELGFHDAASLSWPGASASTRCVAASSSSVSNGLVK